MSNPTNKVFTATSLDGYIAAADGGIGWLDIFPEINTVDSGYAAFTKNIDALLMGRSTFETVCNFDVPWPYTKPVYVASKSMAKIPEEYTDKAILISGTPTEMITTAHANGHHNLYIDGGQLIQSFLQEDLIDEMVITTIPVLLGGGIPLFGEMKNPLVFECHKTLHFISKIAQNHYRRQKR